MSELENLREALSKISEIAGASLRKNGGNGYDHADAADPAVCTPKSLPTYLQVRAAKTATDINPVNAPVLGFAPADPTFAAMISDPLHIAVVTSKYWGWSPAPRRLSVGFTETTPSDLRARIVSHMNAWSCGIQFVQTSGTGQVRISRGAGGYWSYLGTDILHIATNRQTMNLQGFTMNTPESEFKRVIRHEAGHTLGFPHEHMRREIVARIDRQKAYDYFLRTQGWNQAMVDQQVLTPLDQNSIFGTPADQTSIMCYQLPGLITTNGSPILGGTDINPTDLAFARLIYPVVGASLQQQEVELNETESYNDDSGFVFEPGVVA
jgi:Astacin (Peptidase family M12A)